MDCGMHSQEAHPYLGLGHIRERMYPGAITKPLPELMLTQIYIAAWLEWIETPIWKVLHMVE